MAWPGRNMHNWILQPNTVLRKWIPILTAYQTAYAAKIRYHRTLGPSCPRGVNHPLSLRRNEFLMLMQQLAIASKEKLRIPQRPRRPSPLLIDPHHRTN